MNIASITSRQILDSRGNPTLETTVELDTGAVGVAAVPSGASTGSHEAVELRDGDPKRYGGKGVEQAVAHVTGPIAKALVGQDVREQREIDRTMLELDGTINKSKLGANAILSVSLAAMRAHALLEHQPLYRMIQRAFDFPAIDPATLPRPMMNVINGGLHADSGLKIQEFMVVPDGKTAAERIERGVTVYHKLGELLTAKKLSTALGDEGGYAPRITDDATAATFLVDAIQASELSAPDDVALALDMAATTFYDRATQRYQFGQTTGGLTNVGMIGVLKEWLDKFPLLSIEDPLAEDDWEGWSDLTKQLGKKLTLVGDDVFTTNVGRLERGIAAGAGKDILIKPNQVGSLSETIDAILKAQAAKYTVIISHRSGETVDSFVADLAVAVGAPFLKAGAPARGERVAKYNRLLQIERELTA